MEAESISNMRKAFRAWLGVGGPPLLPVLSLATFRLAFSRDLVTTGSCPSFFLVQHPFSFSSVSQMCDIRVSYEAKPKKSS